MPGNWVRFAIRGSRCCRDMAVTSSFAAPGFSLSSPGTSAEAWSGWVSSQSLRARLMGSRPAFAHQSDFLAGAVQFAMVCPAQRDREFVADLEAQAARLRKPQMVRVSRARGRRRGRAVCATNRRCCLSRSRLVLGRSLGRRSTAA